MKEKDFILCDCSSNEHQIIIFYDEDCNLVYVSIHLSKFNFFKRLIFGIKYIFGYYCKYGHWEEFIISKNNINEFKDIINKIK